MKDGNNQLLEALGAVTNIGLTLAATIGIGLFAGRYIDGWLHTAPWCMLAGAFLGVISGFWSVFKRIVGNKDDNEANG